MGTSMKPKTGARPRASGRASSEIEPREEQFDLLTATLIGATAIEVREHQAQLAGNHAVQLDAAPVAAPVVELAEIHRLTRSAPERLGVVGIELAPALEDRQQLAIVLLQQIDPRERLRRYVVPGEFCFAQFRNRYLCF